MILQEHGQIFRKQLTFPTEVLEAILSQLSQPTLRHSTSLVCKQWNIVSNCFLQRTGVWRAWVSTELESPEEVTLLDNFHILDRLVCSLRTGSSFDAEAGTSKSISQQKNGKECIIAWKRFSKIISTPTSESRECPLQRIRYLVIRDIQIIDAKLLDSLLSNGMQNMRTIALDYRTSGYIRLFPLLESAPFLESLTIKCDHRKTVYLDSDDSSDHWSSISSSIIYASMLHRSQDLGTISLENPPYSIKFDEPRIRKEQYKLKHFNITNLNVMHHTLERLVTTCPGLQTLKVQDVNRNQPLYDDNGNELGVVRNGLYRTVILELCSRYCKELEWFHLSSFSKNNAIERRHLEHIRRFLPLKPRFLTRTFDNLIANSLPPAPFLIQAYSTITVLRVHPVAGSSNFSSEHMSQFLCFLPSLLYLYAKDTDIYSKDLVLTRNEHRVNNESVATTNDVVATSNPIDNYVTSLLVGLSLGTSIRQPVKWACKGLRTLELRLGTEQFSTLSIFARHFVEFCPSITCLKLVMNSLTMGQYIGMPNESGFTRGEVEIKSLEGLELLEEFTLSVEYVKGTLIAKDMEYIRSDTSTDKEKDNTQPTLWPRLVAFHIRYRYSTEIQDFSKFEKDMEAMRPGVEFRIRRLS